MTQGTVVVEATKKSGSLITARLAAEQNREVFAVPGSIQSFKSIGTHTLIKQGAKLVENAQDIIEELTPMIQYDESNGNNQGNADEDKLALLTADELLVYEALGPYPVHIDNLAKTVSLGSGRLSSILLKLELNDLVQQSPGNFFTNAPSSD